MKLRYNTMMKKICAMLFGAALLFSTGFAAAAVNLPPFSLPKAVDGKMVSSDSFQGKAMLITFFATWCPPCRQEIPTLKKLHQELGPQGFVVIGLSMDEGGPKLVAKLVEQEKINYPVLMATQATARDFGRVTGIPTSFLVNKKGHVVKKYPGYVSHALLEKDIKSLL